MAKEAREQRPAKGPVSMKVELPPVPEGAGRYANHMMVTYTENEFSLDFWHVYQAALDKGSVNFLFRAILSPRFIKRVQRALEQSIKLYEQHFGSLPEPSRELDES